MFQLDLGSEFMIDKTLLDILVCPETKQTLRPADASMLERLNAAIETGSVTNRGGLPVEAGLTEALVREDGEILFPVRDEIPIVLIDESIHIPQQS